jgi:hypothetical protein
MKLHPARLAALTCQRRAKSEIFLFMPLKRPTRDDDLNAAREIVAEYGLLIGPAGKQSEIIARAVADGIRRGREQALATLKQKENNGRSK